MKRLAAALAAILLTLLVLPAPAYAYTPGPGEYYTGQEAGFGVDNVASAYPNAAQETMTVPGLSTAESCLSGSRTHDATLLVWVGLEDNFSGNALLQNGLILHGDGTIEAFYEWFNQDGSGVSEQIVAPSDFSASPGDLVTLRTAGGSGRENVWFTFKNDTTGQFYVVKHYVGPSSNFPTGNAKFVVEDGNWYLGTGGGYLPDVHAIGFSGANAQLDGTTVNSYGVPQPTADTGVYFWHNKYTMARTTAHGGVNSDPRFTGRVYSTLQTDYSLYQTYCA
jgi:hypothetical protein